MVTGQADATTAVALDLRGLKCPLPVLRTQLAMSRLATDATLCVETTDPLAAIDIPHFCNENGHRLLEQEKTAGGHRFVIARG